PPFLGRRRAKSSAWARVIRRRPSGRAGSVPRLSFPRPRSSFSVTLCRSQRHGATENPGGPPVEALPARMAAVAATQHALITLDQLAELKVTRHQREHLLASGRIVRVR